MRWCADLIPQAIMQSPGVPVHTHTKDTHAHKRHTRTQKTHTHKQKTHTHMWLECISQQQSVVWRTKPIHQTDTSKDTPTKHNQNLADYKQTRTEQRRSNSDRKTTFLKTQEYNEHGIFTQTAFFFLNDHLM